MDMRTTLGIPQLCEFGIVIQLEYDTQEETTFIKHFLSARINKHPMRWAVITPFLEYANVDLERINYFSMISWFLNSGTESQNLSPDFIIYT